MKWRWSVLMLTLFGSQAQAQEPVPGASVPTVPIVPLVSSTDAPCCPQGLFNLGGQWDTHGDPMSGNHNFPGFIGFMSNPVQSIDPRAMTDFYPIFGSSWLSSAPPVPNADLQVFGAGITVALSDRIAVGLNQGGYALAELSRNELARLKQLDPTGKFSNVEIGGNRGGFLNLGGFVQYTLIQDVPNQFLMTGGLRVETPSGSYELLQGRGPANLAPYLTVGKEYCDFHVLATVGYEFPAGSSAVTSQFAYANVHFDRKMFGWLYPLLEFNCTYHTTSVDFGLPIQGGLLDLGNFDASGNIVTMAVGANAVLIPERVEVGAAYSTSIASQRGFDVNELTVKIVLRY